MPQAANMGSLRETAKRCFHFFQLAQSYACARVFCIQIYDIHQICRNVRMPQNAILLILLTSVFEEPDRRTRHHRPQPNLIAASAFASGWFQP